MVVSELVDQIYEERCITAKMADCRSDELAANGHAGGAQPFVSPDDYFGVIDGKKEKGHEAAGEKRPQLRRNLP